MNDRCAEKQKNLARIFSEQTQRLRNETALQVKQSGRFVDISWGEYGKRVDQIKRALYRLGVRKGDRVAILSENRPKWVCADMAILSIGGVAVPLYPTAAEKEIAYILSHCEAKVVFVSSENLFKKIASHAAYLPSLEFVIYFDPFPVSDQIPVCVMGFRDFINMAASDMPEEADTLERLIDEIGPDDFATIIYTSGTTGPPKGVLLTHRNLISNCEAAQKALPLSAKDVSLSFLPLSHVFERVAGHYLQIMCGFVTAFAENINAVAENIREVRPTIGRGVPRFFEKMHVNIQGQVAHGPRIKKIIFDWALSVGKKTIPYRISNRPMPFFLRLRFYLARMVVFKTIENRLGGRMRFFISGGAALPQALGEFFYAMGILILEGYGLTEHSPVVSVNRYESFRFGSVGMPLDQVDIEIAPDGELLVRSASVMAGYFKDDKATQEVIKDGWLHTGDLARKDADGFLCITGRKKDIIITSGGKNISPQNIENHILGLKTISQIVVIGDDRKYLAALIVPDFAALGEELRQVGIEAQDPRDMLSKPAVHRYLKNQIDICTRELAAHEKIQYFTLMAREFTLEAGEITPTLKMKRSVIVDKYRDTITRMYEDGLHEKRDRIFFVL